MNISRSAINYACTILVMTIISMIGCTPKGQHNPYIGHSNYLLGEIAVCKAGSCLEAEFIMPSAYHAFICLVFKGVDMSDDKQKEIALRSLQPMQLHLEVFKSDSHVLIWETKIGSHDLGQVSNWYSPDMSFVLSPPLISYGVSPVVRNGSCNENLEGPLFKAGEKYNLQLTVLNNVVLTNNMEMRVDFWAEEIGHVDLTP